MTSKLHWLGLRREKTPLWFTDTCFIFRVDVALWLDTFPKTNFPKRTGGVRSSEWENWKTCVPSERTDSWNAFQQHQLAHRQKHRSNGRKMSNVKMMRRRQLFRRIPDFKGWIWSFPQVETLLRRTSNPLVSDEYAAILVAQLTRFRGEHFKQKQHRSKQIPKCQRVTHSCSTTQRFDTVSGKRQFSSDSEPYAKLDNLHQSVHWKLNLRNTSGVC